MSKKSEKRISVNQLEKIVGENFKEIMEVQWGDIEISIRRSIPLSEVLAFCKEIVDNCFTDDGEFIPEVMDFVIKHGVLTRYANFRLPENLEKQYWLIYNTEAYEVVIAHINIDQLNEIVGAANRKIKHLCDSDVLAFRAKTRELVELFEGMQKQTENIFTDFSSDDIKTLMSAVDKTGTMSEEKIVEAYINKLREGITSDSGFGSGEVKISDD
jgi:hypothetical protein